ncbi:MAG: hypothetical protein JXA37_03710 [Chloroflexia bacterium]|nr:hypothetical protein [Chloroflexia bacterium]
MVKRILLYGDSIFLCGLAANLQNLPDVSVQMQSARNGPLCLGETDTVIVDLNDVHAADVLAILQSRPNLRVVCVNAAEGAVLSGQIQPAHTLDDVASYFESR